MTRGGVLAEAGTARGAHTKAGEKALPMLHAGSVWSQEQARTPGSKQRYSMYSENPIERWIELTYIFNAQQQEADHELDARGGPAEIKKGPASTTRWDLLYIVQQAECTKPAED